MQPVRLHEFSLNYNVILITLAKRLVLYVRDSEKSFKCYEMSCSEATTYTVKDHMVFEPQTLYLPLYLILDHEPKRKAIY
jgi:hypothetical protein